MPTRIQRSRKTGWRKPENTVCINRGTKWGNPFTVADYGREKAIQMFRECLLNNVMCYCYICGSNADVEFNRFKWMAEHLHLIREADHVACFCPLDETCHGDILIEFATQQKDRMGA